MPIYEGAISDPSRGLLFTAENPGDHFTASSDAERARLMVTQRIKAALRKIDKVSPALGRHLGNAIRTGLFCRYEPGDHGSWNVS